MINRTKVSAQTLQKRKEVYGYSVIFKMKFGLYGSVEILEIQAAYGAHGE
jgi:hypothetical protein